MKEFCQTLVERLVDHPQDVKVTQSEVEGKAHLLIESHQDDVGKVLGKKGKNISAIRTILKAVCSKEYKKSLIVELKQ